MFLEWWMLLILILAAGLWSEYRSWVGYKEGHLVGYQKRSQYEFAQLADQWTEKHGIDTATRALVELNAIYTYTQLLIDSKLIFIDANGIMHGYQNNNIVAQKFWEQ